MEPPAAPVCPDCGEQVVATVCRLGPNPSPKAAAALADVVVAMHRKLAHGTETPLSRYQLRRRRIGMRA